MKITELDLLDKMCCAVYCSLDSKGRIPMAIAGDFTEDEYKECLAILTKERIRKMKTNKRTADYIADKRRTNKNYAR